MVAVLLISVLLPLGAWAQAPPASPPLTVTPLPVVLPDSPVIITGYQVAGGTLNFVQLYNTSSALVSLKNWQLQVTAEGVDGQTPSPIALDGEVLPEKYVIISRAGIVAGSDSEFTLTPPADPSTVVAAISLNPADSYAPETIKSPLATGPWFYLTKTTAGNYTSTSKFVAATSQTPLYGGGFYTYPATTPLRIVEILTNPRDCGPLETSDACYSYVKLFNTSTEPVDMSPYRLRLGYANQSTSITNAIDLKGDILPGAYSTLRTRNDGNGIAMTSSGGNVWLEDSYGQTTYKESAISYRDLGDSQRQGQAWALDTSDAGGTWKWAVATLNGPSNFDIPAPVAVSPPAPSPPPAAVTPTSSLVPCREDQYRSAETNRCRNVSTAAPVAASTLAPCGAGQVRNPATNRCRGLATAASSLVPCGAGEERNPLTNRCRSITSGTASALVPCAANQERNPDTNRCRAVAAPAMPAAAFKVEPIKDTGTAFTGWWALGGVTLLGAGYGAWEWRREVWRSVIRAGQFFTSLK